MSYGGGRFSHGHAESSGVNGVVVETTSGKMLFNVSQSYLTQSVKTNDREG